MAKIIAALLTLGIIFGLLYWLNSGGASNNVTCQGQNTVAGKVEYYLCIAGRDGRVYVPYSVWKSTRKGGYYDATTHKGYTSVDDDPHAPHGHGGSEEGGEGHSGHGGGGE